MALSPSFPPCPGRCHGVCLRVSDAPLFILRVTMARILAQNSERSPALHTRGAQPGTHILARVAGIWGTNSGVLLWTGTVPEGSDASLKRGGKATCAPVCTQLSVPRPPAPSRAGCRRRRGAGLRKGPHRPAPGSARIQVGRRRTAALSEPEEPEDTKRSAPAVSIAEPRQSPRLDRSCRGLRPDSGSRASSTVCPGDALTPPASSPDPGSPWPRCSASRLARSSPSHGGVDRYGVLKARSLFLPSTLGLVAPNPHPHGKGSGSCAVSRPAGRGGGLFTPTTVTHLSSVTALMGRSSCRSY